MEQAIVGTLFARTWLAGLAIAAFAGCRYPSDTAQDLGPDGDTSPSPDLGASETLVGEDAGVDSTAADDLSDTDVADPGDASANGGIVQVVSPGLFAEMFLHRSDPVCEGELLSYEALVAAAATFPAFCNQGSLAERRREAAAFLAHASHETTGGWPTAPDGPYAWGLCFKEELGCGKGACTGYCAPSTAWPCAAGQTYHGRGPMQLSWNYNYGQAGEALGLDLLHQPDLATSDGTVAWRTALWFWMTPQAPKPSCHDVMVGLWTPSASDISLNRSPGFGMTVNIINGGLECNLGNDARVNDRIGFYKRYSALIGVDPGPNLDCASMASY